MRRITDLSDIEKWYELWYGRLLVGTAANHEGRFAPFVEKGVFERKISVDESVTADNHSALGVVCKATRRKPVRAGIQAPTKIANRFQLQVALKSSLL